MSMNHSSASCDWCRKLIDDGADVACAKCHNEEESTASDRGQTITELREEIENLKIEIADLKAEREV